MARPYTLYQSDPCRLLRRIHDFGEGVRVDPAWFSVHLTALLPVEYRARATWANTHGGHLDQATAALRELLGEALRRGRLFTNGDFHELVTGDHVLVLAPDRDSLIEYLHLDKTLTPDNGQSSASVSGAVDPTGEAPPGSTAPALPVDAAPDADVALAWDGTTALPDTAHTSSTTPSPVPHGTVSGSPAALAALEEATAHARPVRPHTRGSHTRRAFAGLVGPDTASPAAATTTDPQRGSEAARARTTEELAALLQTSFVNHISFSSSVLTWAGSVPGQSHTKMAAEIRRSILSAALSGSIRPGRDGTHETSDERWHTVLDPTGTRALFARRTTPLQVECDDPDAINSAALADYLDSERVDDLVITRTILTNAGPAEGQSLDDLRDELLDAVETALEDGHVTAGFLGRHQLYGDGWLMVLSPAGTHMVTARRCPA